VLRLDRAAQRLVLAEVGVFPGALEQVEAEISAERLFDHLAIAPADAGCLDAGGAQYAFVERDGRSRLRHIRIIAAACDCDFERRRHAGTPKGSDRKV